MTGATAELRRWWESQTYEESRWIVGGALTDPVVGTEDEEFEFSIERIDVPQEEDKVAGGAALRMRRGRSRNPLRRRIRPIVRTLGLATVSPNPWRAS